MKDKISSFLRKNRDALNSRAGKIGGYSFILTVIVLAILVAANAAIRLLPSTVTQFDMSAARLYSLTSNTKAVVSNLKEDVTIYWITQSGKEDETVKRLLDVYDALSDNIKVEKKNPDIYPSFAERYTGGSVANNSIVVESGDRYRYIAYDDIYQADYSDYYSDSQSYAYDQTETSFDGEGQITSAINYVVTEDLPKVYVLTGHGERDLSEDFTASLKKQNIETEEYTLLNAESVPEECDAILINAPTSDLSEKEVEMLEDYIDKEGHLLVMAGPQEEDPLTNLETIINHYNVMTNEGIVIEGDTECFAFNMPYLLLTEIGSSDITDPLVDENRKVIVPIVQGLTVKEEDSSDATVTELLTTSSDSFSKIEGYKLETYEKEKGDIDGPFAVAVSIEDDSSGGRIVWAGSSLMTEDEYNSYSSGANVDFTMNALSWLIGEEDAISIRSKSLDYNYLSISESQASLIKIFTIGVIPGACLLLGVDEVLKRRRKLK